MAIVPMTPAVAGTVALSAEYNKLISNITDLDTRTTAVEAAVGGGTGEIARKGGEYVYGSNTQSVTALTGTLCTGWQVLTMSNPNGISHSAGTFTVTDAGLYLITANIRWSSGGGTADRYCMITGNGAATNGTGDTWAKSSSGGQGFSNSASVIRRLPANYGIKVWVYSSVTTSIGREAAGDNVPHVGIYKIGN